jgi:hypothetical protein
MRKWVLCRVEANVKKTAMSGELRETRKKELLAHFRILLLREITKIVNQDIGQPGSSKLDMMIHFPLVLCFCFIII